MNTVLPKRDFIPYSNPDVIQEVREELLSWKATAYLEQHPMPGGYYVFRLAVKFGMDFREAEKLVEIMPPKMWIFPINTQTYKKKSGWPKTEPYFSQVLYWWYMPHWISVSIGHHPMVNSSTGEWEWYATDEHRQEDLIGLTDGD